MRSRLLLLLSRPHDKILGTTVTGKPVHRIGKPKRGEFTPADAASAARIHQREMEKYGRRFDSLAGRILHNRDDVVPLRIKREFKAAQGMERHHATMRKYYSDKAGGLVERLQALLESSTNLANAFERYGWKWDGKSGYQHSPGVHGQVYHHPDRPGEELHVLRDNNRKQQSWMHLTPSDQYEDDGAESLHRHMKFMGLKKMSVNDLRAMRQAAHDATWANKSKMESVELIDENRSTFQVLKDGKVPLSDEERKQVHTAKAVWHHGPNGEPTSAVWKSVVRGKTFYVTNTHRAMAKRPTLKGAIAAYHNVIKATA